MKQLLHDFFFAFILVNPLSGILWILGVMASICFWIVMASRLAKFPQPFMLEDGMGRATEAEKKTILKKLKDVWNNKISGVIVNVLFAIYLAIKDCFSLVKSFFTDAEKRKFVSQAFGTYFAWGLAQQIVCVFIYFFAQKCLVGQFGLVEGSVYAIILTSVLFGVAHTPNFLLMFATFSMQLIYLTHWNFFHNFYALGLAHGFLATTLLTFTTQELHRNFRIWTAYSK